MILGKVGPRMGSTYGAHIGPTYSKKLKLSKKTIHVAIGLCYVTIKLYDNIKMHVKGSIETPNINFMLP